MYVYYVCKLRQLSLKEIGVNKILNQLSEYSCTIALLTIVNFFNSWKLFSRVSLQYVKQRNILFVFVFYFHSMKEKYARYFLRINFH